MALQANSSEQIVRLPLLMEPANRGGTADFDARLVNCYVESNRTLQGQVSEFWLYQRPGWAVHSQPPGTAAVGAGLFNWKNDVYAVFGDTLYKNGTPVTGTLNTAGGVYRFDQCMGATPKMQLGNGVAAYNYDPTNGLVQITDPDFPTPFNKGWAYLNGTTYVSTPAAAIQGSAINDPTSWDPLNKLIAQIEPDGAVALAKHLVYVICFKEWTTEAFYDAANATGSPLGRVEGAKANWGCLSADSVQDIDGALLWLGSTRGGNPEVLIMDGVKVQAISTKPVERLLAAADLSVVYSWAAKLDGHRFYVLTLKNSNLTLVYDIDEGVWTQWATAGGNYLPFVASCLDANRNVLLQHESDGRLYVLSNTYTSDAGTEIAVDIVTPNFDGGNRLSKQLNRMEVICDQAAGSVLQVRFNDFDYNPAHWTQWRSLDLGSPRPYMTSCGSFYRRAYHFRHTSAAVRMPRLQAVELQLSVGTV